MDNSWRSVAANEDSISMYLSFDTDDTMSSISKWQSVASHTSQYMEMQATELDFKLDKTLEENQGMRKILQDINSTANETDHVSPLRPFDKSLLNKHNALSSTPSKIITLPAMHLNLTPTNAEKNSNKENAHPDEESGSGSAGDNSTLSSSVDMTASTVKANTLATLDEPFTPAQQINKTNGNNIYPLSADVILENITEVSNEEQPSLSLAEMDKKSVDVEKVVNEVSELIERVLKISEGGSVNSKSSKQVPKAAKSRLSSIPLPRTRRSMLPASGADTRGYTVKQRMSVVVKTTLNSPARRLSTIAMSRRSCLPTASKGRSSINPTAKAVKPEVARESQKKIVPGAITSRLKNDNGVKPLKRLHIGSGTQSGVNKNSCKYCDKNFALERALHIHLMQNCDKIPPHEKRKLQFTELNHVRKAELPKLGAAATQPARPSIKTPTAGMEKAFSSTGSHQMAPPSAPKMTKNVAHAGVCRTPSKSVLCHTCKQSFISVLDYTNHCLTKHPQSKKVSAEAARA